MSSAGSVPSPRTALIGRADDLLALRELLMERVPVVTIVGTGGAGKTRLAIALAHDAVASFNGQVWFVALAGITDAMDVPAAIAGVLRVRASADRSVADAVCDALRNRSSLLVLDNVEQIPEAARFVAFLAEQCPLLTIVLTSRSPLHISAERLYDLRPLSVATADAPGIVLFCERAQAALPTFELTAANESSVLALCARLDGLPLAIELAASRSPLLSPAELLERFDRTDADGGALRLLSGGARDQPARHRSLEDTLLWSYELLTPASQVLLCKLSVFDAGCTLDAVEAVCSPGSGQRSDILDQMAELVDLRLVVVDRHRGSRFRLLETIREFASVRLGRDAEAVAALRTRHCEHFQSVARTAKSALESHEDGRWIERLEVDYLDLRAALDELERRGDVPAAIEMTTALGWFWRHSGRGVEGRDRLRTLYEKWAGRALDPSVEADALVMIGRLSADSGLIGQGRRGADETVRFLEAGLAMHRLLDDRVGLVRALESTITGLVQHEHGERAGILCDEAVALSVEVGHWWWHSMLLYSVTIIGQTTGDLDRALDAALRGGSIALDHKDSRLAAIGTLLVGTTHMFSARWPEAESALKEAYHASLAEGDKRNAAFAAASLGPVFWVRRDLAQAARWAHDGLVLAQAVSEWRCIGLSMTNMTYLTEFAGLHEAAARFYGAMRGDFESFFRAMPPEERRNVERLAHRTRRSLGDESFERLAAAGAKLTQRVVIEEALHVTATLYDVPERADATAAFEAATEARRGQVATLAPDGLTRREVDVLVLLASGSTNREIAEELHLSIGTIERHLVNVYRRIGVRGRTEATAYAIRHRLGAPP